MTPDHETRVERVAETARRQCGGTEEAHHWGVTFIETPLAVICDECGAEWDVEEAFKLVEVVNSRPQSLLPDEWHRRANEMLRKTGSP